MSWRLEPSPRSDGLDEGLAARIHDPLWLLTRQWQLGEFRGQDAGTPALVNVSGNTTPVNAWRGAQQTTWSPFDPNLNPLDELVEPEDESSPDLRERIESGAHFQRLLVAAAFGHYTDAFLKAHAFDAKAQGDAAFVSDPLLAAVARRQPDGVKLHATAVALVAGQAIPVTIDAPDIAGVTAVAASWLSWYGDEIDSQPGSGTAATWQEHRLEYGFAVSNALGDTVLTSQAYLGDGMDWFDFDIDPTATGNVSGTSTPVSARAVPSPVRYGGMPLPRFWAMEDARYDFGSVGAAANDIGRMLLIEFATVYGNDWFVLPLKLNVGSLTILNPVIVSDVFGRNLLLNRAGIGEAQWNLFSLSTVNGAVHSAQSALLLPPTAGYVSESTAIETVIFARDEMADLAWGIETKVEDDLERVVDRRASWVGHRNPPPGDPAEPSYRVETIVPNYWIPLAPEQEADQQSIHLRLVPMEVDDGGVPRAIGPQGRLLTATDSNGSLWVFEEEIPREGMIVNRVYRFARWSGGRSSLWTARSRSTGKGESSSGLKFDVLDPP